jgi:hypothetical protein
MGQRIDWAAHFNHQGLYVGYTLDTKGSMIKSSAVLFARFE